MRDQIEALFALQQTDTLIARAETELGGLDHGKALRREAKAAKVRFDELETQYRAKKTDQKDFSSLKRNQMAEEQTIVKPKLQIAAYAKVKVFWDDKPEHYSREGRNRVKSHFARKYGVHKNNVNVVFRPVKVNAKGETIEITGAGIDNIMDVNYQRQLFKEWLERHFSRY